MDFAVKHPVIATVVLWTILVIISGNRNPVKTIAFCRVLKFSAASDMNLSHFTAGWSMRKADSEGLRGDSVNQ